MAVRGGHGICALLLPVLCSVVVTGAAALPPTMRDPTYRGVQRVVILAQYGPAGDVAGGAESAALCAEVLSIARQGAPVPVTCGAIGDAVLAQAGTLVLVAQASVMTPPAGDAPLFAIAMRAQWEGGLEPAPVYFGAAPRMVSYSQTMAGRAARRRVLSAAVADTLPWGHQGDQRPSAGIRE